MARDPATLFQELWEPLARRVATGKHTKDAIRFFMMDGSARKFDIPPMRDDQAKEAFLRITLDAINNRDVEALLINFEMWFVDTNVKEDQLQEFLDKNPRPSQHPRRREGISFYYETADGTMHTSSAEIITGKKGKRHLEALHELAAGGPETRFSHLFKKAREYAQASSNLIDDILRRN